MTEENNDSTPTKVVLLGETAVGKSCLISRFVSDKFQSNFVPTMGGCYSSKEVSYNKLNKKLKYEIWDTAGQEKYRSINKIFYQDASVAILVYDITRKDSFEELKNYWYIEVRDNSPKDVFIEIAANKSDLYEYEEVNNEELEEFAKSINAIYKETSALNGNGVEDAFNKSIEVIIIQNTAESAVIKFEGHLASVPRQLEPADSAVEETGRKMI